MILLVVFVVRAGDAGCTPSLFRSLERRLGSTAGLKMHHHTDASGADPILMSFLIYPGNFRDQQLRPESL